MSAISKRPRARRPAGSAFGAAVVVLLGTLGSACNESKPVSIDHLPERASQPPDSVDDVYAPERSQARQHGNGHVIPLVSEDREYDQPGVVHARRLVYRAHLTVPDGYGPAPFTVTPPPAELYIDVTEERLRATFAGHGWPVEPGSQVRIRAGDSGVYIFDSHGGRPLGPGRLSAWFNGGPIDRGAPPYRVAPAPPDEQSGPGRLICRLIAEWTDHALEDALARCGAGGAPAAFTVGPWTCERTADVAIDLPRRSLRADHGDPPEAPEAGDAAPFLSDSMLTRIRRNNRPPPPGYSPAEGSPDQGLRVENRLPFRVVILVNAVPVGWVASGANLELPAIPTGLYQISAMRVFGIAARQPEITVIPNLIRLR